ncbi:MAG: hypothetical protein ABH851_05900 [Methanobacteriota archaeon]
MSAKVDEISRGGDLIAIVIPTDYSAEDTRFFTPPDFSQQLAFIRKKAGTGIKEHTHKPNERIVTFTQEVLVVRKGRVKVNLFDKDKVFICDRILTEGDVILLVSGGHGFEFLEDTELIEVKQGPYSGDDDKERFEGCLLDDTGE